VPFVATEETFLATATELVDAGAGVMVVIGDADAGIRLLSAIGEISGRFGNGRALPDIVINGAMRRPSSPQLVQQLPPDVRQRIQGVGFVAFRQPAEAVDGPYATNAENCVNLIALAAVQAGSDAPEAMAAEIVEVSDSGVPCSAYADCLQLLTDNRSIDYEGPEGDLQIGAEGDPAGARFQVYTFDETGTDQSNGRMIPITP
jgi:branched-chain amino acid transport system substrate-binding protein